MEAWKIGGSWVGTVVLGVVSLGVLAVLLLQRAKISKFVGEDEWLKQQDIKNGN